MARTVEACSTRFPYTVNLNRPQLGVVKRNRSNLGKILSLLQLEKKINLLMNSSKRMANSTRAAKKRRKTRW